MACLLARYNNRCYTDICIRFYVNLSNNSGIVGLEMFEEPGDYMEYSQFEVFKWLNLDVLWLMPMTLWCNCIHYSK